MFQNNNNEKNTIVVKISYGIIIVELLFLWHVLPTCNCHCFYDWKEMVIQVEPPLGVVTTCWTTEKCTNFVIVQSEQNDVHHRIHFVEKATSTTNEKNEVVYGNGNVTTLLENKRWWWCMEFIRKIVFSISIEIWKRRCQWWLF